MSDYDDVFKAIDELAQAPHSPQIRIYLLSVERLPVARFSDALPDYEIVLPRSNNEVAFIRKIGIGSEEEFRVEYERAAAILAPLLVAGSYLGCLYDDPVGRTRFQIELRKTAASHKFIERDEATDPG